MINLVSGEQKVIENRQNGAELMRYLTFALAKGRLAKQTLELFEKIGITCEEMKDPDSRKLIFTNEELKLRFLPGQRAGCAHLCGIRGRGHRGRGQGHHPGGGPEGP